MMRNAARGLLFCGSIEDGIDGRKRGAFHRDATAEKLRTRMMNDCVCLSRAVGRRKKKRNQTKVGSRQRMGKHKSATFGETRSARFSASL